MTYAERKEEALKKLIIEGNAPSDLVEFWEEQIELLRKIPIKTERRKLDLPYKSFDAYEIKFNTHDATEVLGYLCVPKHKEGERLPLVLMYHGGGNASGIYPDVVATGVCTFSPDVRSQGALTYDKAVYDICDDYRGALMTHGVLDKNNFYMRNIYLDAVRAAWVGAALPEVDPERIVAHGQSQGGALSIFSAIFSGVVKKVYPSVPSFSCLVDRVEAGSGVFEAVKKMLTKHPEYTDTALDTLSYFDINNLSALLRVPSHFSLGLIDGTCLPKFVYSVYHHAGGDKKITLDPFTPHRPSEAYLMEIYREFANM